MTIATQVMIIGAGPTGLTLAVDLRRRGIDCLVIERDPVPHRHSRGKGLQPRTLEVLEDLGVLPDILEHGVQRQVINVYKDRRRLPAMAVGAATQRPEIAHPNIVMIPQWRTCAVLAERLRELGGTITYGRTLRDFTGDHDGVTGTIQHADGAEEPFTADYLVGCDGGGSTVRKGLGIAFEGESRPSARYLLGDVIIEGLQPYTGNDHSAALASHAWIGSDGSFLGLAGLPEGGGFQIGAGVELGGSIGPSVETLQRLLRERTGRPELSISEATWLSDFTVNVRLAERYRDGRVFIAGDAAHVHPPTGGQGMNTGIQDAYNLGWKLALVLTGRADERLLDTYQAERRPIARDVLAKSTDILDVIATKNPVISLLLERILLPLLARPTINRALLGRVSQIDVGYRGGPLAGQDGRHRLRPGDRAPDALVIDLRDGQEVRLHRLLTGPEFVLLHWGRQPIPGLPAEIRELRVHDDPDPADGPLTVRDHRGTLARAYRPGPGEAILIRPDGYLIQRWPAGHRPSAPSLRHAGIPESDPGRGLSEVSR